MSSDYLIVHKSVLPEYFELVIKARENIEENSVSVSNACREVGISRSTYYKYKDYIYKPSNYYGKKVIISFKLIDNKGILSNILNFIANKKGNVLAIHQEAPIHTKAYLTITIDILEMEITLEDLISKLRLIDGVAQAELLAVE